MSLLTTSTVLAQQFLPVKSIVNARDLGGHVMQDGRILQDRVLLRSAHLADATEKDLAWLAAIPVAKVIDFRKEEEKLGKVDKAIPGSSYVCLPIDASGNAMASATEQEKKKFTGRKKFEIQKLIVFAAFNDRAKTIAREMYPTLLFNPECQQQFARFFQLVLETDHGAVLFHCTQGKDRTGVASALLLAALGADKETIIADFDATNKVYAKDVKKYTRRVKLFGGKEEEIAVVKAFIGCNTENFIKALDSLEVQYGSLEAYLKGPMGLTDEDIQTLRKRYLREAE
jgi:protein-tyrosine phosphatase